MPDSPDENPRRPEWTPEDADPSRFAGKVMPGVEGGHDGLPKSSTGARKQHIRRPPITADDAVEGILGGDRTLLARAITLIESRATAHRQVAEEVLARCLPHAGGAVRVGITGTPGAGKSTLIECLGLRLAEQGKRLAVLAVDPTSAVSGGSVLGDKTRMEELARHPGAFIRPSPSGGTLGGVAARTREAMALCEAAGFDVVLVETVGVGQSEIAVRGMVDFFLLLQIAGAGDDLQGIKKGVIEMADAIVVNKADGDNLPKARAARAEYDRVLHYLHPYTPGWKPRALACSARTGDGVDDLWDLVETFRDQMKPSGTWDERRREQKIAWMHTLVRESVLGSFLARPEVAARVKEMEHAVAEGKMPVAVAVREIVATSGS